MLFPNQIALITGATGGIGSAIAKSLAIEGAAVHLVGRNTEVLTAIGLSIGERAVCHVADIAAAQQTVELAARIERECGRLDILVHSAGVFSRGAVAAAPVEELDIQYQINLRAPFLVTQAVLPLLRRSRGQIVFLNSTAGLVAQATVSQYAASKHGLKAFADSLREEVNADGVRVLSVFLGRTASPMQRAIHELEGKPYRAEELIQPEDVGATIVSLLGLPRTVEVTNIAMRPLKRPVDTPGSVPPDPGSPPVRAKLS